MLLARACPSGLAARLGQNVQSSQSLPNEEQYEPAYLPALGTALHRSQTAATVKLGVLGCNKDRAEVGETCAGTRTHPSFQSEGLNAP
jgi:hypothetical protein